MNCVEYGKEHGEVIMLLHAGGLSWWNFRETAQLLEDRFRVVLPILPGHAGSGRPFVSIEETARELIDHIDGHFGGKVLLLGGLSLGGQVLVEMLSQRADICRFAVVESALVQPMRLTAMLAGPACRLCAPLVEKRWFAKLQFRALNIKEELFEDYYAASAGISPRDMAAFLKANANYAMKPSLSGCEANALVLVGGRERAAMRRSAEKLAGCLTGAESEVIEGYTHGDLSLNHPEEYGEKLLKLMGR